MPKKDGEFRLLKSGVVYGPMSRDDFERLRSVGKVTVDELVSVRGGSWMTVADFVIASAIADAPAASAFDVATGAAALDDDDPVMRLLTGNRVVTALSRAEINQLRQSGRVDDDDLVCALYGPWMRIGDFFAPPREKPPATLLEEDGGAGAAAPRSAPSSARPAPMPVAAVAAPGLPAPVGSGLLQPLADTAISDDWFVRVRGVHSAPLHKRHVKALFDAKEITRDSVARHVSWPENVWRPIYTIAQLDDCVA